MAYARARRHYRVAQEETQKITQKGLFIPENKKSKLIVIGIAILFVIFLKGMLFGYIAGKDID